MIRKRLNDTSWSTSPLKSAAILVFSIGVTILFALYAISYINKVSKLDVHDRLDASLAMTQQTLVSWTLEKKKRVQTYANLESIKVVTEHLLHIQQNTTSLLASNELVEVRRILEPIVKQSEYLGFYIVAPNGKSIASSQDENIGTLNALSSNLTYSASMLSGETFVTIPQKSKVLLRNHLGVLQAECPTMFSVAPISDGDGTVIANLLFRIDPSVEMYDIPTRSYQGFSGETYAINDDLLLLSNIRFEADLIQAGLIQTGDNPTLNIHILDPGVNLLDTASGAKPSDVLRPTLMAQSVLLGNTSYDLNGYRDYRGVPVVGVWTWDDELGYGLASEMDLVEAYLVATKANRVIWICAIIVSLLLLLIHRYRIHWRKQFVSRSWSKLAVGSLAAGLVLTVCLTSVSYRFGHRIDKTNFISNALERVAMVQTELGSRKKDLRLLVAFYESSSFVTHDEFTTYCASLNYQTDNSTSYVWLPFVTDEDRTQIEQTYESQTNLVPFIWSVTPEGAIGRAKDSNFYFPASYVVPAKLKQQMIGLNHYSVLACSSALDIAMNTGLIKATSLQSSLPEQMVGKSRSSVIVYAPVYVNGEVANTSRDSGKEHLVGFVASIVKVDLLLQNVLDLLGDENMKMELAKPKKHNPIHIIDHNLDRKESVSLKNLVSDIDTSSKRFTTRVNLFGEDVDLVVHRESSGEAATGWNYAILVLFSGLTFTILITWYCYFQSNKTRNIESEVEKRTAELAEASRAKSEFLASMSHELRTPLNGVIGMTELLMGTKLDGSQRQFANACYTSGKSLLSLINNVLDFSKIEAGCLELDNHEFNLEELIVETTSTMALQIQKENLELICQISPEITGFVIGDEKRLRQIIVNLIGNALKFTKQGEIAVRVEPEMQINNEVTYRFSVTDTGIGIPEDRMGRLFRSFSQVDNSTSRQFGGTGLGLAISKDLVDAMGGQIHVESEEGSGSTFWFTVPLLTSANQSENETEMNDIFSSVHRMKLDTHNHKILLVEDNATNQKFVQEVLLRAGYQCDLAENGVEAVEAVRSRSYDLILMDCNMPEMDGFEATRVIRDLESYDNSRCHVPIIALTANAIKGDRERCLSAGMDDYLTKPIEMKELIDRIASFQHQDAPVTATSDAKNNNESASESIDLNAALARCLDDPTFLQDLFATFKKETPNYLAKLSEGIEAGDADAVTKAAHTIKGAAGAIVATPLQLVAAELEELGQSGDISCANLQMKSMLAECDRCYACIDAFMLPKAA